MSSTPSTEFERKLKFLSFILWAIFLVFSVRLFYLQVIQGRYYELLSENNYSRSVVIRSPRGDLLDDRGRVLARNRVSFALVLNTAGGKLTGKLAAIKRVLNMDFSPRGIQVASKRNAVPNLTVIARDVPVQTLEKVEANQEELPFLRIEMELRREYPFGELASHVLGYVGLISRREAQKIPAEERDPFTEVGKSGVEKMANAILSGRNGLRTIQVDSHGREVSDPRLVLPGVRKLRKPVPGKDISLTLDAGLQAVLEKAFGEEAGSAVFMNPQTGAILAWVSLPNFDPNLFSSGLKPAQWKSIMDDPKHPLLNRPIQGIYPPGSAFKPLVALAGLEEGLLSAGTTFFCPGYWIFGGRVWHCWTVHGKVNLIVALQNSCNVFFYHAANLVGIENLDKWGALMGFGEKTGVGLPGERSGTLPSPAWKRARKLGNWVPGDTLPVGIGQGYLTVTPLQLLDFYAALASGGKRYRPSFVKQKPELIASVKLSPEALAVVKEGLWRVVNAGGTGVACAIPGLGVCAKTGTAQVVKASAGRNTMSLPKKERDHAWFAGFAPRDNAAVAFVVMVEHGGHGGGLAARIARKGLEYLYFGRAPGGLPKGLSLPGKDSGMLSFPPAGKAPRR